MHMPSLYYYYYYYYYYDYDYYYDDDYYYYYDYYSPRARSVLIRRFNCGHRSRQANMTRKAYRSSLADSAHPGDPRQWTYSCGG